jgi:ElaB/YqjD/DUF883 family membrane-anchored ribosome-binding protein
VKKAVKKTDSELDKRIRAQAARLAKRAPVAVPEHVHTWGTAYKSSSGRKVCTTCGHVTDKPFDTLGVGDSKQ